MTDGMNAPIYLMEIVFGTPDALYLLWGLIPLVFLLVHAQRRRTVAAARWIAAPMQERLMPVSQTPRVVTRYGLLVLAIALLVFAAARPRFGTYYEAVHRSGRDLVVLLDVSRSMLSEDVYPSRLDRAKSYVRDVLARLQGDRIGLVVFAGRAVPSCPLTTDQGFFGRILKSASPDDVPRGGTAIGDAIRVGLESLDGYEDRERAFLLLTDGEDQDSFPREAAGLAAARGVRIFTVGIGDAAEGARVPTVNEQGGHSFLRFDGQEVWSRLDEDTLKEVALLTGGAYVPAQTGSYDLGQIYEDHLQALQAGDLGTEKRKSYRERYQIFAGLGLLAYLLSVLLRTDRRAVAARGTVAAVLMLSFLFGGARAEAQQNVLPGGGPPGEERVVGAPDDPTGSAIADSTPTADAPRPGPDPEPLPEGTAIELHNEGVRLLRSGDVKEATRYLDHAADESDDPRIGFAAGAAHQRNGDRALAESRYTSAAAGGSADATLLSRYNLGTLTTDLLKETLGDSPDNATAETRKKALAQIDDAVAHFRAALRIDPSHQDARHNLELLRLYKKHMADVWKRKDEEKPESQEPPPDPRKLLQQILLDERPIRSVTLFSIEDATQTTPGNAALTELTERAESQRAISRRIDEEVRGPVMELLDKQKDAGVAGGGPSTGPAPGPDAAKEAEAQRAAIVALLDTARDEYAAAADGLAADPEDAAVAQAKADHATQTLLAGVGGYPGDVEWALKMQQNVVRDVPLAWETGALPATAPDLTEEEMNRVAWFAEVFLHLAEEELPKIEEQIEQLELQVSSAPGATPGVPTVHPPSGPPGSGAPGVPGSAPQAPSPEDMEKSLESLRGVAESMRRAIERAPEIPALREAATDAFARRFAVDPPASTDDESADDCGAKVREIEEILKYIAEPLPKDDGSGSGGDDAPKDDDQKDGDPPKDEGDNPDDKDTPPDDKKDQDDSEQKPPEEQEAPADPKQNTQEQIEELLQQALAREKAYLEMKKELARRLAAPVKVEKDW